MHTFDPCTRLFGRLRYLAIAAITLAIFASARVSIAESAPLTPAIQPVPARSAHQFTIATQQIERFSSLNMPPEAYATHLAKISLAVRNILLVPDILGLQGIGNTQTLQDIAAQISADAIAAGQTDPEYAVCADTSGSVPAADTAFLYSQARINVISCAQATPGTTTAVTGVRQPMVLIAGIRQPNQPDYAVTVISSHITSAAEVDSLAALMQQHRALGEHVVSLSDGNAASLDLSSTLTTFASNGLPSLVDLSLSLPVAQRYSYIDAGTPELRDTIVVTPDLAASAQLAYAHMNAGSPAGFSDHDPAIAYLDGPLTGSATLTPASQDFSSIIVGQSSSAITFTFTNSSGTSETVNSVTSSDPGEFPLQASSTCPTTVATGSSCTISVIFSPSATGARSSTLTVNSTDATNPSLTSALTGTGVAATTTSTLTPTSATFPNTNIGSNSTGMQFVLTNTGNTAIGSINVGASGDFSATYACTTLAPSATCNINVVFSPTASGTRTGTLTVSSTSSSSPLTASLTGTGLAAAAGLTLSASSLNLGSYEVGAGFGSSQPLAVYITNNDSTTITFTAPPFPGTGTNFPVAGQFTDNNNCTQTLASGSSCLLNAFFTPSSTGTQVGTITFQSNASNGTQTLTLSGNGTSYSVAASSTTETVTQGNTAVYPITLTPISGYTGTIDLNCTGLTALGTSCDGNSSVTLGPATTVNFNVTTTSKNVDGVTFSGSAPGNAWNTRAAWLTGLGSLLLLALAGRTRRLARAAGLLALLLSLLLPTGGCSGKQPSPNPDATPPGTYTFTLTSSDAAPQKTLTLTLVVTAQ